MSPAPGCTGYIEFSILCCTLMIPVLQPGLAPIKCIAFGKSEHWILLQDRIMPHMDVLHPPWHTTIPHVHLTYLLPQPLPGEGLLQLLSLTLTLQF